MSAARAKVLRWERRPEERPQELLEAALHVFATRGYRNARLEDVAAAAGVTKGAVYHYFANKEELLLRALEAHREQTFGRIEDALRDEHAPASVRLRLFFRKAFEADKPALRDVLVLLQSLAYEVPDVYRQWIIGGPVKSWRSIASLIEDGKASGEFRPDVDSEVAARVVLTGVLVQAIWQTQVDRIPELHIDPDRLIDSAVELLLAGLRPVAAVPLRSHSRDRKNDG